MCQAVKFIDYDIVAFDFDNTLVEYNLSKLFPLQYELFSNFMVDCKSYKRSAFPERLTPEDADFIVRGLFLDYRRGNILRLRSDGMIIKASHGTVPLNSEAINEVYEQNKFSSAQKMLLEGKLHWFASGEILAMLDFVDCILPLIFAKAVDFIDREGITSNYTTAWNDVLDAFREIYKEDSLYFQHIIGNMSEYLYCCDDSVISWLKSLKKTSKLVIISSCHYGIAKFTIPFCFGGKHLEIFDLIICDAKKPLFFNQQSPFETIDLEAVQFAFNANEGIIYRGGNWSDVYDEVQSLLGRPPKSIYIGDNPIYDVYPPTQIENRLDTIWIAEELASDGVQTNTADYIHSMYLSSKFWGPFLCSPSGVATIMGSLLKDIAALVVPSVRFLSSKPVDFEHHNILQHIIKSCP